MAYQTGQKLGNYQLERFLGHGGFAEVYLGKHIYLHTQAAIKVLQKQSNSEALEKFLQEARIIAGLKHPHIVGVLEFGIEEQRPYLVMAYAPHGTLRRRYKRGIALSPALILPHVRQVADALYYAHEHKIIHRDVKPENMLLDNKDTVLLSDFGLALRERSTYHSVHSTDSAGTTIYMSPEQLKGKPCAASDQYALGVVLYEWLCGCLPFDGPDVSVVVQHLHELPESLREHVPTLSPAIEAVVLRALEKDPQQRFANVRELAEAFEEACEGIPIPENAGLAIDVVQYSDVSLSLEDAESWQGAASGEFIKLLPDSDQGESPSGMVPDISWPTHYSSLQAPSLSASLHMSSQYVQPSTLHSKEVTNVSTRSEQNRVRVSRRSAIAGIAGIAVILGGAGIWRLSSSGVENFPVNVQAMQGRFGGVTPASTSGGQTPGNTGNGSTPGVRGTAPASGSGNGVGGTTNPTPAGKGGSTGTSTPSTSSNGTPVVAGTSTPGSTGGSGGVTPVATGTSQGVTLTVQISAPASIARSSNVALAVMTNPGNISIDVTAEFYYTDKKGLPQNDRHANISGNATDGSGNAAVNWQCWSIPYGQFKKMTDPRAVFQATATDSNGKLVYSQTVTAQVV